MDSCSSNRVNTNAVYIFPIKTLIIFSLIGIPAKYLLISRISEILELRDVVTYLYDAIVDHFWPVIMICPLRILNMEIQVI